MDMTIAELGSVLRPLLNGKKTLVTYAAKPLDELDKNYGSCITGLDLTLQNGTDQEVVQAVVKLFPTNEFMTTFADPRVTFKKEIGFYSQILPALKLFQAERGVENLIDFCPRYYGSRFGSNNGEVDATAVLILENVKVLGYVSVDRFKGFDLETTELIIQNLAVLHSVAAAFKMINPDEFDQIKTKFLNDSALAMYSRKLPPLFIKAFSPIFDLIESTELREKAWAKFLSFTTPTVTKPSEPFSTLIHNDCWVNNCLVTLGSDGKAAKNILLDYQFCEYGSPAKDLLFLLFTSVESGICSEHYEHFMELYLATFTGTLNTFQCDTSAFTLEALHAEMKSEADSISFNRVLGALFAIFMDIDEDIDESLFDELPELSKVHKDKFVWIISEFAKKDWI